MKKKKKKSSSLLGACKLIFQMWMFFLYEFLSEISVSEDAVRHLAEWLSNLLCLCVILSVFHIQIFLFLFENSKSEKKRENYTKHFWHFNACLNFTVMEHWTLSLYSRCKSTLFPTFFPLLFSTPEKKITHIFDPFFYQHSSTPLLCFLLSFAVKRVWKIIIICKLWCMGTIMFFIMDKWKMRFIFVTALFHNSFFKLVL